MRRKRPASPRLKSVPRALQAVDEARMRRKIARYLPRSVPDRAGWAQDVVTALSSQRITLSDHNVCSVLAVAEQEATYQADPVVPNLSRLAWQEIDKKAAKVKVPQFLVRAALSKSSPNGKSYVERINRVRTERQMSEIFEDIISEVPLGKTLFSGLNPVRTGGAMQVGIKFSEQQAAGYPYPIEGSIRREVFTRRGGIWFGTKHIFGYPADYPDTLYRFADFNAGWYASRNAAFQAALSHITGKKLALDGDLVNHNGDEGETERAIYSILHLIDMTKLRAQYHLLDSAEYEFADSKLYHAVFALAEKTLGKKLPRAVLPGIQLKSPKITRNLTTAWFAKRVDVREQRCVKALAKLR
ncbi:MAG: DUF1615 domain-containing protein [Aeromonas sp.]